MKIDYKILIISLIFTAGLYILLYKAFGYFAAGSFLAGALASIIDIFALASLARSMLGSGYGWLFIPVGILRWALFALVIFVALYYFKAMPVPLLAGVGVPFFILSLVSVYYIIRGGKDGASS